MALIPPFFLDCVVAIGTEGTNDINWIGTGFIVGRYNPKIMGSKSYNTFLITNKHILDGHKKIILRFNSLQDTTTKDYTIHIVLEGKVSWTGHPDPNVDVACISINPNVLQDHSIKFNYIRLDEHVMDNNELTSAGASEGDPVFVLGFPMGIVSPTSNYVIARGGVIARIRDLLAGHSNNFLIDVSVYPGNSGGPVVIKPVSIAINDTQSISRSALIGVVKSYVPYKDVAISKQTGNPRVIFEENSGLALVESVDSIKQTVDLEFCRQSTNS